VENKRFRGGQKPLETWANDATEKYRLLYP
jgi:hypothetical protein